MTPLAKLNPTWIGRLRPNSGEGITFDCPTCGPKHRLVAYFKNPLDGNPAADWPDTLWQRNGDDASHLTVTPSIDYPCWHGWIERGRVFADHETPLTVLLHIDGVPQLVRLSPEQTIQLAEQAAIAAEKMLGE